MIIKMSKSEYDQLYQTILRVTGTSAKAKRSARQIAAKLYLESLTKDVWATAILGALLGIAVAALIIKAS